MGERKLRRVYQRATPEQRARDAEVRKAIEAERPRLDAESRESLERYEAGVLRHLRKTGVFDLSEAVGALKAAREAEGLTLAQVSEATGMSVPALSSLENGRADNPTLRTLQRYAKALGRRLVVGLVAESPAAAR
jgi:hypothetical protein